MTSKQLVSIWVALIAVAIIAGWALVSSHQAPKVAGTRFPNGLSVDSTSPIAGQVRGSTLTSTGLATLASASVTGVLSVATSSPSAQGDVVIEGTATTTLLISSSSGTKGSCIQMENSVGAATAVTINGTTVVAVAGLCK